MSKRDEVGKYVFSQISILSSNLNSSSVKAKLAELRRGVGKVPGELPELWGSFLNGIPDDLLSPSGEPTEGEWAIYLALTLYALHQQRSSDSVHTDGISFGKAAAKLMDNPNDDDERERILRRFGPVVTAKDMPELSHHVRGLIQLIRSKNIHLDYIKLAEDLYDFQYEKTRNNVRLRWGQDFYYIEKGEE